MLSEWDERCQAVTFNNLGCFYRKAGRPQAALSFLLKAQRIEARLPEKDVDRPADTFLNLCAVLSQLGRHSAALEHGQSALILLQEELFGEGAAAGAGGGASDGDGGDARASATVGASGGGGGAPAAERLAVLAIAYHNIGVEQEHLARLEQSLQSYRKGVKLATKYLSPQDPVLVSLKRSYFEAHRAVVAQARLEEQGGGGGGSGGFGQKVREGNVREQGVGLALEFDALAHNKRAAANAPLRRGRRPGAQRASAKAPAPDLGLLPGEGDAGAEEGKEDEGGVCVLKQGLRLAVGGGGGERTELFLLSVSEHAGLQARLCVAAYGLDSAADLALDLRFDHSVAAEVMAAPVEEKRGIARQLVAKARISTDAAGAYRLVVED